MAEKYEQPGFEKDGFHCPHCDVWAHQVWGAAYNERRTLGYEKVENLFFSVCRRCDGYALWLDKKMIYPEASVAPLPSEDMPPSVKEDFVEARNVVNTSSRSAAALLRLAVQKLMIELGEKGKNLDEDIGNLVAKGLPEKIQKALDSVRVIGNNAIHPGQIDLRDDTGTATSLFELLNIIVEAQIAQQKKVDAMFDKLPKGAKNHIKNRDERP
ncbi:hypothetical protein ES703_94220 [subsurface metagenome]